MSELIIQKTGLIGRAEELSKLTSSLENAIAGNGSTVFIAGEAGIGKTRLVSELLKEAEAKGCRIVRGWCLAESLGLLMPFKAALREAELLHLISGEPPPLVVSAYLINEAGMLIAKAEREQLELDSDIFAGMLQAVGHFVKDSLGMMGNTGTGGLNSLGFGDYTILIQSSGKMSIATVIKGAQNEFLIGDMRNALENFGKSFDNWSGDVSATESAKSKISWFLDSGKYDGKFLVDDPKLKQENIFDNVLLGLERAASERPLLLFLDDLQWADPTSLNLLHYLARNTRKNRIFILGTYRPEDIIQGFDGRTHQLETAMQNMSREDLFERIELNRLGRDSTEFLINGLLGATNFEPNFYSKIHKESGGTPFFVLEVVKLLVEESAVTQDENGAWVLARELDNLDIPDKIYDVVKRRLDRLKKGHKKILDCASVVGEEFQSEVVSRVTGLEKLQILEDLNEIEKTHKLIHSLQKRYKFDHAKVREVLYNGIMDELKQEYHRLVGDTIAELHKDNMDEVASELAYHFYEAGDERAGKWLVKAGNLAKSAYANEEAIRFYKFSLNYKWDNRMTVEIHEKIGDLQILVGKYDDALASFNAARGPVDDRQFNARLLRKCGEVHQMKGDYKEALNVLTEAKGLAGGDRTIEHGWICMTEGEITTKLGDRKKALELLEEAYSIFTDKNADLRDLSKIIQLIGTLHYRNGNLGEARKYQLQGLEIAKMALNDPGLVSAAYNNLGNISLEEGKYDLALDYYMESLQLGQKIGYISRTTIMLSNMGNTYCRKGDFELSLEYHKKALAMKERFGQKWGIAASSLAIGVIHFARGELDLAKERYDRSYKIWEKMGDKGGLVPTLNNIGEFHLMRGEPENALEVYGRSLAIAEKSNEKIGSISTLCGLALTNLNLGSYKTAFEHAEKALKIAEDAKSKSCEGKCRWVLGTIYKDVKDFEKSEGMFMQSIKILEECGNKGEVVYAHYEYGLLLAAIGRQAESREHLEKSLRMFKSMGMKLWAEKCLQALSTLSEKQHAAD